MQSSLARDDWLCAPLPIATYLHMHEAPNGTKQGVHICVSAQCIVVKYQTEVFLLDNHFDF